jgi:hypothetical protein
MTKAFELYGPEIAALHDQGGAFANLGMIAWANARRSIRVAEVNDMHAPSPDAGMTEYPEDDEYVCVERNHSRVHRLWA